MSYPNLDELEKKMEYARRNCNPDNSIITDVVYLAECIVETNQRISELAAHTADALSKIAQALESLTKKLGE